MKVKSSIVNSVKKRVTAEDVQTLLNARMKEMIGGVEVEEDGGYDDEAEGVHVTLLCVRSARSHNDLLETATGHPLIYDHRQHTWIHDPVWKKAHALAGQITSLVKLAFPAALILQLHRFAEYNPDNHAWRIGVATKLKQKKKKKKE